MTPDFWLNLQRMYDLEVARASTDVTSIEPMGWGLTMSNGGRQ